MKTISLITKTQINAKDVNEKLISAYPFKRKIVRNDDIEIFLGKTPREFYIIFDEFYKIDSNICMLSDEQKSMIPFKDAYVIEMYYWDDRILKYVVETLLSVYSELYICDYDNNILSAEDFIK